MDENSLFTPFDEITQTRELQMLKTIIPYMPHDSQKQMTLMVHYISLMNSMRMIDCAPALSVAETESMSDRRLSMLNALKKYCSKSAHGIDLFFGKFYAVTLCLLNTFHEKRHGARCIFRFFLLCKII